jgi:hypothetical protein
MKCSSAHLVFTVSLLAILSAALPTGISSAEESERGKANLLWGKSVSGLSCSIRLDKTVYAPGEDILLDFFLRSEVEILTTVIRPWISSRFWGPALPLMIVGPKGRCKYTGPYLSPPEPPRKSAYVQLTGGEILGVSSYFTSPLRIVPKYWSMEEPGEYTILFVYRRGEDENEYWDDRQNKEVPISAWKGELSSNSVTIRVVDAKREKR